jgi:type III restriction enzyme
VKDRRAALDNPQEFASQAARVIREEAVRQLVDGIRYEKDGTWYDMIQWVEAEETSSDRLVNVDNSIYDRIVVQSETERKFAERLKKRKDVRLFVKLPAWFKVPTPVGQYNPDWALVMAAADDPEALLYLVRETKGSTAADDLRGTENQKIHCGERHFVGALRVDYRVVTSADDLS